MVMVTCSSKFRWPPPPPPPTVCNSYSLPSAAAPPIARHCDSTTSITARGKRLRKYSKQLKALLQSAEAAKPEEEEEEEFQVLTAVQSKFNHIIILDTPKSRLLLLDSTHNVHSMLSKESKWTGSYWLLCSADFSQSTVHQRPSVPSKHSLNVLEDEFAALPPVVPRGPIAIFGLGGGTAAHLMLYLWPSLQLEGWEIDDLLIDKSRDYFGLCDLEKQTIDGGVLNIHIGDVFSQEAAISGGYAGIIVDLFAEGKVLPQLEQANTWLELHDKLMPGGRLMVNCGAGENAFPATKDGTSTDGSWKVNATLRALCEAFPGHVNWKKMPKSAGENYLALTGSLPDFTTWSAALPNELDSSIKQWRACNIHDS